MRASGGLRQSFGEDVMRLDLHALPPTAIPAGITVQPWEEDTRHLFFQAYQRSFADRPGFPGWSQQQWIDWTVDDAFRPTARWWHAGTMEIFSAS